MNRDVVRQTYQSNLRKRATDLRRTHRRDILVTADSHEELKLITANYRKRKRRTRTRTKTRAKTTRTRTRTRRKRAMTRTRTKNRT